jgi:hypothetical protein
LSFSVEYGATIPDDGDTTNIAGGAATENEAAMSPRFTKLHTLWRFINKKKIM